MTWEYDQRHKFEKLCKLGDCAVAEYIAELVAKAECTATAVESLHIYANLDSKNIEVTGGGVFPLPPIHVVGDRRGHR